MYLHLSRRALKCTPTVKSIKYSLWKTGWHRVYRSTMKIKALKGYRRYKTITSQNAPSKAQIKNFFISKKNYVPFSRYSSFCIFHHAMIYQISDVTMSISTWDKVHLWIYHLNHKSWSHETWPVDRYKQVQ